MKKAILYGLITALCCGCLCLLKAQQKQSTPTPDMHIIYASPQSEESYDNEREITVLVDGIRVPMLLHDYLTGVLLGEIPASFSGEACKAQAVAARTFTLRILATGKHDGAICTKSSCCQAYVSKQAFLEKNQGTGQEIIEAMSQAVSGTDGLVLEYNGFLIDAVFFSCSGGKTEAAVEVWGSDVPYLQSVESPGEEDALPYTDEKRVSRTEFCQTLLSLRPEADFSGSDWVGDVRYTQGGGVAEITLGGAVFTGLELRSAFSLRSTSFTLRFTEEDAVFLTKGFGHRVGMSQYGANAMAQNGSSFAEILAYYYQGTELINLLYTP